MGDMTTLTNYVACSVYKEHEDTIVYGTKYSISDTT